MQEPDTGHPIEISVGFAGRAAVIRCQDAALGHALRVEFRHILVVPDSNESPDLMFRVSGANDAGYSLECDGRLVVNGLNAFDIVQRLLYELTLALAQAATGSVVLHAAGLEVGGRGIVLAGASGSGKSTLAVRLGASGARFLSDELVAIDPATGLMHGFARPAALKASGTSSGHDWLSHNQRQVARVGPDRVVRIDPDRVGLGEVRHAALPEIAILPSYVAGPRIEFRPITRSAAVYRLLPVLLNAASFSDRGLRALRIVVDRMETYELRYGDGEAAVAAIQRLSART